MSDQKQESQSSKAATLHISEEKQLLAIAKIKELFEKENFRKNSVLTSSIQNALTNAIYFNSLFKDKSIQELGLDQKSLEEILKKDELKASINYNQAEGTVAPTWKRLRNILYLTNIEKDQKIELQNLIEQDIRAITSEYKLEYLHQTDSIKITVTTPNQEEAQTKVLFDKLFMKGYTIGDKTITINCAIEEEQFSAPVIQYYSQHTAFKNPNNQYPAMYNQNLLFQQYMMYQSRVAVAEQQRQQQQRGKLNRIPKQHQNNQFVNKNGGTFNNNAKATGNNLHQPTHGNKQQNRQGGQKQGGRFNKSSIKQGGNKPQRVFNANENDFPTLQ